MIQVVKKGGVLCLSKRWHVEVRLTRQGQRVDDLLGRFAIEARGCRRFIAIILIGKEGGFGVVRNKTKRVVARQIRTVLLMKWILG